MKKPSLPESDEIDFTEHRWNYAYPEPQDYPPEPNHDRNLKIWSGILLATIAIPILYYLFK